MKKLKPLKEQYKQEKQAFSKIRKIYVDPNSFSNEEVLNYFNLSSKKALIKFTSQLKIVEHADDEVVRQSNFLCTCTNTDGMRKEFYKTKRDAERVCILRRKELRLNLVVYPCPTDNGWHLTKG